VKLLRQRFKGLSQHHQLGNSLLAGVVVNLRIFGDHGGAI
jgi:hypothetical protein